MRIDRHTAIEINTVNIIIIAGSRDADHIAASMPCSLIRSPAHIDIVDIDPRTIDIAVDIELITRRRDWWRRRRCWGARRHRWARRIRRRTMPKCSINAYWSTYYIDSCPIFLITILRYPNSIYSWEKQNGERRRCITGKIIVDINLCIRHVCLNSQCYFCLRKTSLPAANISIQKLANTIVILKIIRLMD